MTAAAALPAGYGLRLLPDRPDGEHAQARRFCLRTIEEFYGFAYRPDWHADLDSLLLPAGQNHYSTSNGGAFWMVRDAAGAVAATAGVRHLAWKPNVVAMFPDRYRRGEEIASLWRVYVRADLRGYRTIYLHASSDAPAALSFWKAAGYGFIGTCDTSTHFDKRIGIEPAEHVSVPK